MARPQHKQDSELTQFDDLRTWLGQVEEIGQLERISGAHWDLEVGALNEIICERLPAPPALLFENVAGHQGEGRVLANMMETMERTALTLNLPLGLSTMEVIDRLRTRLGNLVPVEPRVVPTGPVMENRKTGKDINILEIPVPRWHSGDGGRYLGTAHLVVTRDPETGLENVGCYRVMVHESDKLALYISPGKHGRMHMEKTLQAGKPVQVAMAFGQHPLMFVAASQAVPPGLSEYAWAGGLVEQPLTVIEAPLTGLRVPAAAEIVVEGEIIPGDTRPEGPFGEWTGYYASARRSEPVVQLKALYHRDNPILTAAPPFRPTIHGMYRSMLRSAMIWERGRAGRGAGRLRRLRAAAGPAFHDRHLHQATLPRSCQAGRDHGRPVSRGGVSRPLRGGGGRRRGHHQPERGGLGHVHTLQPRGVHRHHPPHLERAAGSHHPAGQEGFEFPRHHRRHPALRVEGPVSGGQPDRQENPRPSVRQVERRVGPGGTGAPAIGPQGGAIRAGIPRPPLHSRRRNLI